MASIRKSFCHFFSAPVLTGRGGFLNICGISPDLVDRQTDRYFLPLLENKFLKKNFSESPVFYPRQIFQIGKASFGRFESQGGAKRHNSVNSPLWRHCHSLAVKTCSLFLYVFFCALPLKAAVNLLSPAGGATGVSQSPALAAADLAQTEVRYPGTRWIMRYETQNVPLISVTGSGVLKLW